MGLVLRHSSTCSRLKLLRPKKRILPCSLSFISVCMDFSKGTSGSGQWIW